jgi:hypothetical protein
LAHDLVYLNGGQRGLQVDTSKNLPIPAVS